VIYSLEAFSVGFKFLSLMSGTTEFELGLRNNLIG
jgi:hypothetical protein